MIDRKYYIDNLRWMTVMVLFFYHSARIFDANEMFYVTGAPNTILTYFVIVCSPWFMPVLFALAGVSSRYALLKRTNKEYLKERVTKLLIPLISGILLLIPAQTYYAERFHNGYTGGFFKQYILFFTKDTDFSGYSGGFTPGQLWFILYLFIISLLALPIINLVKNRGIELDKKFPIPAVLSLSILIFAFSYVLNIGGKSVGEYFIIFLLGYFILSSDDLLERLEKYRWIFTAVAVVLIATHAYTYTLFNSGILFDLLYKFVSWVSILALLGLGKRFLNFTNRITQYFSKASFPLYIFHQTWIVLIGYYVLQYFDNTATQYILIVLASFVLTLLTYEVARRMNVTSFLFGIKRARKNKQTHQ